jgi:cytoplasmic iron level regulating protein YaaA (DUF328/UPF0246 family)
MDFSSKTEGDFTIPDFLSDSETLIKTLKKLSHEDISSLMKLSHKLTELNFERYRNFLTPFNADNAKQAGYAFQGDVYDGLQFKNLSNEDVEFAQNHLRILSGLYGFLTPLDLIQPYRLEMGTSLKTKLGKNLYDFWGEKITKKINKSEEDLIINLASNEYYKVLKPKLLKAKVISPAFKEYKNGKYSMIMLYAKQARGLMAQFIIKNKITNADDLKSFNLSGYSYNDKLSSESEPVFTR